MQYIGGFYELELSHGGSVPHPGAIGLSTGRACLTVMLEHLMPKRVHVPFYTCNTTFEPFARLGIETRFYGLDETLFPLELPALGDGEYFLWTNYFGVCSEHTSKIKKHYGEKVLLDDTHSFFNPGHPGYWSFTVARKYFGVPDGAFLYAPVKLDTEAERFDKVSLTHSILRRLGRQREAYEAFEQYDGTLDSTVYRISEISEGLLRGVDMARVAEARRRNYDFLHAALGEYNQLPIGEHNEVPFCYPYLPVKQVERKDLYERGLFIPSFWIDTRQRGVDGFAFEKRISVELLPLPVDHRYTPSDLQRMADYLKSLI